MRSQRRALPSLQGRRDGCIWIRCGSGSHDRHGRHHRTKKSATKVSGTRPSRLWRRADVALRLALAGVAFYSLHASSPPKAAFPGVGARPFGCLRVGALAVARVGGGHRSPPARGGSGGGQHLGGLRCAGNEVPESEVGEGSVDGGRDGRERAAARHVLVDRAGGAQRNDGDTAGVVRAEDVAFPVHKKTLHRLRHERIPTC